MKITIETPEVALYFGDTVNLPLINTNMSKSDLVDKKTGGGEATIERWETIL
uniref:Uncharacterized protein n=1 Tax=Octopus bimaculoides TaxID=37653 RepID=A0A0L8H104_OCTBM